MTFAILVYGGAATNADLLGAIILTALGIGLLAPTVWRAIWRDKRLAVALVLLVLMAVAGAGTAAVYVPCPCSTVEPYSLEWWLKFCYVPVC